MAALPAWLFDYLVSLTQIFISPKQFLLRLPEDNHEAELKRSFGFIALTAAFCLIINIPFLPPSALSAYKTPILFVAGVALTIIGTAVFALTIHVGCRIAGGKAPFLKHFIYSNYLTSVAVVIITMFSLFGLSAIMMTDADLFKRLGKGTTLTAAEVEALTLSQKSSIFFFLGMIASGLFAAFFWFITAWGAFRSANQLPAWRSLVAFAVAFIFAMPVLIASLVMALGFTRGVMQWWQ